MQQHRRGYRHAHHGEARCKARGDGARESNARQARADDRPERDQSMLVLGVFLLDGLADQLRADSPHDLPLANGISVQRVFGSASRSLEAAREIVQLAQVGHSVTRHRPTP